MRSVFTRVLALAVLGLSLGLTFAACSTAAEEKTTEAPKTAAESPAATTAPAPVAQETFAVFETSMGNFTARLAIDKAPKTAQNFIDLAEGKKPFLDPSSGQMVSRPFFDGRKIFRVVKAFMFQTGAASDENSYQAGFTVSDEFSPDLTFSKPGILAMANTGAPNSGACQFFITTGPEWHMGDGKYSIFGEVTEGMDTVVKIDAVPVGANAQGEQSLPAEMPVIKKVTIKRGK